MTILGDLLATKGSTSSDVRGLTTLAEPRALRRRAVRAAPTTWEGEAEATDLAMLNAMSNLEPIFFLSKIHFPPIDFIPSGGSISVHTSLIFMNSILDFIASNHLSELDLCMASV